LLKSDDLTISPTNDQRVYKARPLTGIWATAPYLHNGSVPNLAELLTDDRCRMSNFSVGNREFDPDNVGFVITQDVHESASPFDARFPGNRNIGHSGKIFGTELKESEKWDLIEFLKTL
jgi:hypothetical protein